MIWHIIMISSYDTLIIRNFLRFVVINARLLVSICRMLENVFQIQWKPLLIKLKRVWKLFVVRELPYNRFFHNSLRFAENFKKFRFIPNIDWIGIILSGFWYIQLMQGCLACRPWNTQKFLYIYLPYLIGDVRILNKE